MTAAHRISAHRSKAYFGLKLAGYTADHPALAARPQEDSGDLAASPKSTLSPRFISVFSGSTTTTRFRRFRPRSCCFPTGSGSTSTKFLRGRARFWCRSRSATPKSLSRKFLTRWAWKSCSSAACDKSRMHLHWAKKLVSWRNFFLVLDRLTHWFERVHVRPLRSIALKKAEKWMLERFEMSDGLGAIYPSMMNAIIALRCLGYSLDDPQVIRALDEFEKLGIEEEDTFRMQPCKSPVWDTAYALFALGEAGVPANDPRMVKCADWILQKQVRKVGDWKVKNREGQPGGWYFEFNNEFYPDVDDSAMVCLGLSRVEHPNGRYQRESVQRAIDWIFSMQCKNGGWASFDKDNDRMVFQHIPFADHNAMLDPPTVDITGRILEMLATYGYDKNHPAVKKAITVYPRRAGAGWQLVRALGRELHLRHGAGAARTGSHGHRSSRALYPARRRVASHGAEPRRRMGRDCRLLRRSERPRAWARALRRRPPGQSWACWRRATRAATRWPAASRICCARKKKTARGTSLLSPAPASRACSI